MPVTAVLLLLAPALLVFTVLACGRYPGERAIGRWRSGRRRPAPRRAVARVRRAPRPVHVPVAAPLAGGHAVRPPPAVL